MVPVIAMLCSKDMAKYNFRVILWSAPTKLAISLDHYSIEQVEELAARHKHITMFYPVKYDSPAFYIDNRDMFEVKQNSIFSSWIVAKEKEFDFNHWQLRDIQYRAKKALEEQSQDCHSKEYKIWLEEQAVYYNNGFYEADKRHGWEKTSYKDTAEKIAGGCKLIYEASEERWDKYSHASSWANIIKRKDKIIVYGNGEDICGSDWMNYYVFWLFDTEEEMKTRMKTWKISKVENKDVTEDFIEFLNHNPKAKEKFQLIR